MVVNALSRKHMLINTLSFKLFGFECLKTMYPKDPMFSQIFQDVRNGRGKYDLGVDLLLSVLNLMVCFSKRREYMFL